MSTNNKGYETLNITSLSRPLVEFRVVRARFDDSVWKIQQKWFIINFCNNQAINYSEEWRDIPEIEVTYKQFEEKVGP